MPIDATYAVWSARHKSGKTTCTKEIVLKYSRMHPDRTVLAIDLCSQADLTRSLLAVDSGGRCNLRELTSLRKEPITIAEHRPIPRTVSGYLDIYTSIPDELPVDCRNFLVSVCKCNTDEQSKVPYNLYMLAGDESLDVLARSLEAKRYQADYGLNRKILLALKDFIHKIAERKGIRLAVFIDIGSTYNIMTEIGLAACDKLLIPVNQSQPDWARFDVSLKLVFDKVPPAFHYLDQKRHVCFKALAEKYQIITPKICCFICFGGYSDQSLWVDLYAWHNKSPWSFVKKVETFEQFVNDFVHRADLEPVYNGATNGQIATLSQLVAKL